MGILPRVGAGNVEWTRRRSETQNPCRAEGVHLSPRGSQQRPEEATAPSDAQMAMQTSGM